MVKLVLCERLVLGLSVGGILFGMDMNLVI